MTSSREVGRGAIPARPAPATPPPATLHVWRARYRLPHADDRRVSSAPYDARFDHQALVLTINGSVEAVQAAIARRAGDSARLLEPLWLGTTESPVL